jgi:hypothetical protein
MSLVKKIVFIMGVFALGLTESFIYMNDHLFQKSASQEGLQRITALEKSNRYCPLNDRSFYELGKSYYDLAERNLDDSGAAESYIRKSVENLRRAILINPSSPFSHFYYGQALSQLSVFSPHEGEGFLQELRRAAQLAGEDSQILNSVGRQFLSNWDDLTPSDKDFAIEVLKKTAAKRDDTRLTVLLNAWELNVGDYEVLDRILPSNARTYRFVARFLGERSLSLAARKKYLIKAETLDFSRAQREFQEGKTRLFRFQVRAASTHFQTALDLLRGIAFYQALGSEAAIGQAEYSDILKSTLLDLAKCRIELRAKLSEVEDDLLQYLVLETLPPKVSELESYLRDRGVLPEKFDRSAGDFHRLYFELFLLYRQTRYREIIDFGRSLERSLLVVPEAQRPDYLHILDIIGDSLQKADYLYDASDIYQKAKEIDSRDLETLVRVRDNSARLNDDIRGLKNEQDIEKVISPRKIDITNGFLSRGQGYPVPLVFDGRKVELELLFGGLKEGNTPLVAVFFNDRVVWEDYLGVPLITLSLETKIGRNELRIVPVNRPVTLARLTYQFSSGGEHSNTRRPN